MGCESTRKNSPNVELYGLHGFPLTYFYADILVLQILKRLLPRAAHQILSKPKTKHGQHTPEFIVRVANTEGKRQ